MIHHLHGKGFPAVKGSAPIERLERIIDRFGNRILYTFDDRLPSQQLAIETLNRRGIKGYFFIVHHNVMEQDRITREQIPDFYNWFLSQYPGPILMPDDFLANYPFYSIEEKQYRYIRDIQDPEFHTQIMADKRKPLKLLELKYLSNHIVGLHSYSHPPRITRLTMVQQWHEWLYNYQMVASAFGTPFCMSHPLNDYDDWTLECMKMLRISIGFRSDNVAGTTNLELPRIDINHEQFD